MFAKFTMLVLIALPVVLAGHFIAMRRGGGPAAASPVAPPRRAVWQLLLYLALMGCIVVLGVTALGSVLVRGAMVGRMMWAHSIVAGAFVVVLAMAALVWAEAARGGTGRRWPPIARVSFWLLIVASLLSLVTMLAMMLKFVDSHGQSQLMLVHRYAGLAVVAAAIAHAYGLFAGRGGVK